MNHTPSRTAPILAAILLLGLILASYVGSYLALVTPPGKSGLIGPYGCYRGGEPLTSLFFYPLEQLDRRLRPETWKLRTRKE